ncbi:hypothetical protein B0A49_01294 [Cryomyces minteri]|uniref:Ribosomal protein mS38 C-terminal domain-containing protein n=1 Tax=Cryomyces minteri TaxID=331657 RepID=A0A4V5NJ14_9PEZI|nr:hypothetical protein B0A49_01294 [Cryomyces minteri]
MFDVGGQRSERKKWIHVFDNVQVVLFLVAISGYDHVLVEDRNGNQMHEALMLFESISNSNYFSRSALILFLNKIDLFREKLLAPENSSAATPGSRIADHFPDYTGADSDVAAGSKFFADKFKNLVRQPGKDVYVHFTNATDTDLLKKTMLTPPASSLRPAASIAASARSLPHERHQRRLSSSKTSCPPSNGTRPPASEAPRDASAAVSARASTGRFGRRKSKAGAAAPITAVKPSGKDETAFNLPSVPSTHHLLPADVGLSTFFSLHRPISITSPIPPPSTEKAFAQIFQARTQSNVRKNPSDVIYTLSNTVNALDSAASSSDLNEESNLRWEIVQESDATDGRTKHLDGVPRPPQSLEQLVAQFRPFNTPPAPVPFSDLPDSQEVKATSRARSTRQRTPRQKSYTTTLIVTESTHANGHKTYTASTSPIVQIPNPGSHTPHAEPSALPSISEHPSGSRQPFLERMRIRQDRYEEYREERAGDKGTDAKEMLLISVKRQRKLKMKKHKYKKLMKRTRNLRRRLDRK